MKIKIEIELTEQEVKSFNLLKETAEATYINDIDLQLDFIVSCIIKSEGLKMSFIEKCIITFDNRTKSYKFTQIGLWFLNPKFKEDITCFISE